VVRAESFNSAASLQNAPILGATYVAASVASHTPIGHGNVLIRDATLDLAPIRLATCLLATILPGTLFDCVHDLSPFQSLRAG
jgi:hypothetical protein